MEIVRNGLILLVAFLHLYFLYLEMFMWTKPLGRKAFRMTEEQALQTATLAGNQGLYNGFLAAGLIWSVISKDMSYSLSIFFLSCVIVAAVYGAYSVSKKILFIQGFPAILAMAFVFLS